MPRPCAHLLLYHGGFAPPGCCREGAERWPNERSAPHGAPTPGGEEGAEKAALSGAASGGAPPAASGLSPAPDPGTEGSAAPRAPPENCACVRRRYFRWAELLGQKDCRLPADSAATIRAGLASLLELAGHPTRADFAQRHRKRCPWWRDGQRTPDVLPPAETSRLIAEAASVRWQRYR